MSQADRNFTEICREIIDHGSDTATAGARAHWEDGAPAYTLKTFAKKTEYNLQEEYPVQTLRKSSAISAFDEMLWIYQLKSNNIHDLHSHIWDSWADETGSIGKAYGYQVGIKSRFRLKEADLIKAYGTAEVPQIDYDGEYIVPNDPAKGGAPIDGVDVRRIPVIKGSGQYYYVDQIDMVLFKLKTNPFDRANITNLLNPREECEMGLRPCAYNVTYNVTQEPGEDKPTLNLVLMQRSQDMLAAFAWNELQYSLLLTAIAQVSGMKPGKFVHFVVDAHIYDRHVPAVEELIARTPLPAPKVWMNPEVTDFYQFTRHDVKLLDYEVAGPQVSFPVAI